LKYQEAAELLARKAHVSSEEARLQAEKALEIETQLERCKFEINRVNLFFVVYVTLNMNYNVDMLHM
jgi:hypothetical protein